MCCIFVAIRQSTFVIFYRTSFFFARKPCCSHYTKEFGFQLFASSCNLSFVISSLYLQNLACKWLQKVPKSLATSLQDIADCVVTALCAKRLSHVFAAIRCRVVINRVCVCVCRLGFTAGNEKLSNFLQLLNEKHARK